MEFLIKTKLSRLPQLSCQLKIRRRQLGCICTPNMGVDVWGDVDREGRR
jgi:hypothetical protein